MLKQRKPYPAFPLTAHPNGQWVKKIKGKLHYFGKDAGAAEAQYREQKDDLEAGRQPRKLSSSITTEYLIAAFLDRCSMRVAAGDLSPLSLVDYHCVGKLMVQNLGKTTDPEQLTPTQFTAFRFALKYSPARMSKIVTATRSMFKWAIEAGLMKQLPNFGPDFKVAKKKAIRLYKAQQPKKLLTAAEIKSLIQVADPKWKAILLLCINGGLGNTDIARLKVKDVGGRWLNFARPKTGVECRVPLWPETQQAVAEIAKDRDPEELLFRSPRGKPMIVVQAKGHRTDTIATGFNRIATVAGIHRPGMGIYHLRHTFQTEADEAGDPAATSTIMAHAHATMTDNDRGRGTRDERLLAVVNHVREWLFQ